MTGQPLSRAVASHAFAPLAALVLAAGPALAQQPPAADPLALKAREATDRAARGLAAAYEAHQVPRSAENLVALALLRSGGPEERACAARILDAWWEREKDADELGGNTYATALGISALEALELEPVREEAPTSTLTRWKLVPISEATRSRIQAATRALLLGTCRGEDDDARAFGYQCGTLGAGRALPASWKPPAHTWFPWDNSCTQFATLALHDAARAGATIPREVVAGLAQHYYRGWPDSGPIRWRYSAQREGEGPAMTYGALSSLAILRELGESDPRLARGIERGLEQLDPLSGGLDTIPWRSSGWGPSYALLSLEKALDLLGTTPTPGRDWFAPLAQQVLARQGANGLWQDDVGDSALYVLFLTRGTIGSGRVQGQTVEREDPAAPPPEAVAKIRAFGSAANAQLATARADADLAIRHVVEENRGREAGLLAPLAELLVSREARKREQATAWLVSIAGREPTKDELKAAAKLLQDVGPRPSPASLAAALAPTSLLPLRTYAARHLEKNPDLALASDLLAGADSLWREAALETPAGDRCARAHAAALAKLVAGPIPELPETRADPPSVRWLVRQAREAIAAETAADVEAALAAHALRDVDGKAWEAARTRLVARGKAGLERLVSLLEIDAARRGKVAALLRTLANETLGDDPAPWKAWLAKR